MDFFKRYWRQDRLLPFAVAGFIIATYGFHQVVTTLGQKFDAFVSANKDPLLIFAAGAALFVIGCSGRAAAIRTAGHATRAAEPRPKITRGRKWLRRVTGVALIGLGVACYVYLIRDMLGGRLFPEQPENHTLKPVLSTDPIKAWIFHPVGLDGPLALILAGIFAVVGAALCECRRRGWFADLGFGRHQRGLKFWQRDAPWLIVFLAVWFAVNVTQLETRPGYFTGDEANVIMQGRRVYDPVGMENNQLTAPWENEWEPYGSCILRALVRDLFPNHRVFGSRLPSLVVSLILLSVVFLLSRSQFGRFAAWITVFLIASNHVLLSFFRRGYTTVDAMTLVACILLAFLAAWRTRRVSMGLLSGYLAGCAFYTYSAALVSLPLLGIPLIVYVIKDPRILVRRWAVVAVMLIAMVCAAVPDRLFFDLGKRDPNWYRNSVFILSRDALPYAFDDTVTRNVPAMLVKYSWPSIGGLMLWPRNGMEYDHASNKKEMIDRDACAMILLGLLASLVLWRRRMAHLMVPLWWLTIAVCGGLLTRNAPYIPRTLGALVAGFVIAGWALGELVGRARRLGGWWLGVPFLVAAFGWTGHIAYSNMRHFYVDHLGDMKNSGYHELNMGLTEFYNTLPKDAHLIYWAPRGSESTFEFPAMKIYHTGFTRQQIVDPAEPIPPPNPEKRTAYLVDLSGFGLIDQQIQQMFPNLKPQEIFNRFKPGEPATHHVYWIEKGITPVALPPVQPVEPPPATGVIPTPAMTPGTTPADAMTTAPMPQTEPIPAPAEPTPAVTDTPTTEPLAQ